MIAMPQPAVVALAPAVEPAVVDDREGVAAAGGGLDDTPVEECNLPWPQLPGGAEGVRRVRCGLRGARATRGASYAGARATRDERRASAEARGQNGGGDGARRCSADSVVVLLDEPGGGTDPAEGAALATAVLRASAARARLTVATSHYEEVKALAGGDEAAGQSAMVRIRGNQ